MARGLPPAALEAAQVAVFKHYSPGTVNTWRDHLERDARSAVEAAHPVIVQDIVARLRDCEGGEDFARYLEESLLGD
jgi:hypothetical protein